jgi:hypothetical protein
MANQIPGVGFVQAFSNLLLGFARLFEGAGHGATSHWLTREYVRGMFEFAARFCPTALPPGLGVSSAARFSSGADITPIVDGDERVAEIDEIFRMDFENYTVGRLMKDRSNYDMTHAGLSRALAYIRGRAWNLGWRPASYGELDRMIAHEYQRRQERPDKVDRYGKKYGWIGFYEYAGQLDDEDALPVDRYDSFRLADIDIDPSFPSEPPRLELTLPLWTRPTPREDQRWIRNGSVKVPDDLLRRETMEDHEGPWVAAQGYLTAHDEVLGRRVWGFVRAMLVRSTDLDSLVTTLVARPYLGNDFVSGPPESYYLFAGEVPWSRAFAAYEPSEGLEPYQTQVDGDGQPITVELLAHTYAYEAYHSVTVRASGFDVPSRALSESAGLSRVPPSLDHVDTDGRAASITRRAPEGFDGHMLYLREDIVRWYAGEDRRLVWLVWGEREIDWYSSGARAPEWLSRVASGHGDLWRRVSILGSTRCEDVPGSS